MLAVGARMVSLTVFYCCLSCRSIWTISCTRGWSGGAMVLGNLPVPGRPTFWIVVGQGPLRLQ